VVESVIGRRIFRRRTGEVLHPERESREVLDRIRQTIGEYNFAGQYQQEPAPFGGGMVKVEWFKTYEPDDLVWSKNSNGGKSIRDLGMPAGFVNQLL